MTQISVIITTNNEADNIEAALQSVQWADEIMVVDSFSEDNTVELAKKYTNFVVQRAYQGPANQKNWAISQVKYPWVLILDADERVPPVLKSEIQQLLQQKHISKDAYWIRRQNYFMGKKIRYSGWQSDAVIRLIKRDVCRYNDKQVHEKIDTQGIEVGRLQQSLNHYTFKNTVHFVAKMNRYGVWSGRDYAVKIPKVTYFHLFIKPIFRFFKHYLLRLGFLDGKEGFIISVLMAWTVFLRYVEIYSNKSDLKRLEKKENI